MDDLGPDEQRYVTALRAEAGPTEADKSRVRAAVLARVAGAGAIGSVAKAGVAKASGGKAAGASLAALLTPSKIGIGVASLALAAGLTTAVVATRPRAVVTPPPTAMIAPGPPPTAMIAPPPTMIADDAPPPTPSAPTPLASASAPEAPSAAPAASPPPKPRPTASSARAGSDIDNELALLTEAQTALNSGNADAALRVLARHARTFPHGAFSVEREGLRAIAKCETNPAAGRALAQRFVDANPRSPLVARVRTACLSP